MRGVIVRVGLLLAGVVVAIALAEAVVRVLFPDARDHALPMELFARDDRLGWRLAAGAEADHRTVYFTVRYSTSSEGFRDRERGYTVPSSGRRMLLYGDSQVFGWGVEEERRFSNLLEQRVPGLEVCNLGVPGYGVDQQLLHYEWRAREWRAEEVALFVTDATVSRLQFDYLFGLHKPRLVLDAGGVLQVVPPERGPSRYDLYRFPRWMSLPYAVDRVLGERVGPGRGGDDGSDTAATGELLGAAVDRAVALAGERGHRLILLLNLRDGGRGLMDSVCGGPRVECVDLGLTDRDLEYRHGPRDLHWNERGHAEVAAAVERALAARRAAGAEASVGRDGGSAGVRDGS